MNALTRKCRLEPWHFPPTITSPRYRQAGRENCAAPGKSVDTYSIRADRLTGCSSFLTFTRSSIPHMYLFHSDASSIKMMSSRHSCHDVCLLDVHDHLLP